MTTSDKLDEILAKHRGLWKIDDTDGETWSLSHEGISDSDLKQALLAWRDKAVVEARIDEVRRALSYNTMEELRNRFYHLCDQNGGTPVKIQYMTKQGLESTSDELDRIASLKKGDKE